MRAPKIIAPVAACLLVTTPILAATEAPIRPGGATKLFLANPARVGAPIKGASKAAGEGNGSWIIGAIGLAAGVTYAFIRKADQDNDQPASP